MELSDSRPIKDVRRLDTQTKIKELKVELPSLESFSRLGDLAALRLDSEGNFYRSNYERGTLLYCLVAAYRPKTVLEFGTGRGYGALCVARALVENRIDGRIYSIDMREYDERRPWPLDDGDGPRVEALSWADVWPKYFPSEWLERVTCLNGNSVDVMRKWRVAGQPSVDLAFIDGGHDYLTVKHDFFSLLHVAAPTFRALFDDYADRPNYGICKLIDGELSQVFEVELIERYNIWLGERGQIKRVPDSHMALIDSERTYVPWRRAFPEGRVVRYLKNYDRKLAMQRILGPAKDLLRLMAKRAKIG